MMSLGLLLILSVLYLPARRLAGGATAAGQGRLRYKWSSDEGATRRAG